MLLPYKLFVLLVYLRYGLCSVIEVTFRLPDDQHYRTAFAYMSINQVPSIASVTPKTFVIDTSSSPNRIVFKPDFLPGTYNLTVKSADSETYVLSLKVERLSPHEVANSIYIYGPTSEIKSLLNSFKKSIRLISIMADIKDKKMTHAAFQVMKPEDPNLFLPLGEAYQWALDEFKKLSPDHKVHLMPSKCKGKTLCRSQLNFAGGLFQTHEAKVDLESNENFMGFRLVWEAQTATQIHRQRCGPATCLNGGQCATNFKGTGYRCRCPFLRNTPWGPRCEHPTRSYFHNPNAEALVYTRHWIGDLPSSSESLDLSFEFSGTTKPNGRILALLDVTNSLLIGVNSFESADKIIIQGSLFGSANPIEVDLVGADFWSVVHILVTRNSVTVVICRKSSKSECSVQTRSTNIGRHFPSENEFINFWLEIGKALTGCVQSVLVNGYNVDLAAAKKFGDTIDTETFCHFQNVACGKERPGKGKRRGEKDYVCGDHSVCYGPVKLRGQIGVSCTCKCLGSNRKIVETIIDSNVCRLDDSSKCSKEASVITTRPKDEIRWTLNGGRLIPMPSKDTLSLEIGIQTEEENVPKVISARITDASGSLLIEASIKMSNGFLSFCLHVSVSECHEFPQIRVNHGDWHSVSAEIKRSLLVLTVDGVSSLYLLSSGFTDLTKFDLTAAASNMKLRNIRVNDIYMPVNNKDDRFVDSNGEDFIMVMFASDPTDVIVRLPDDESFMKSQHAYITIKHMENINSVSSPNGTSFRVDSASKPNRIVFKPDLQPGTTLLTLKLSLNSYILALKVERVAIKEISSSVYITGLKSDVNKVLSVLKSSTRILSKAPVSGTEDLDAAIQVMKPGSTSVFLPLSEAYEMLVVKYKNLTSNVHVMRGRCQVKELCHSRLTFVSGVPDVHEAVVELLGEENIMGFKLTYEAQTVAQIHAERCGPTTCLNGGKCDVKFKGAGYRCTCPSSPNTLWGPRCKHPTRSYNNIKNNPSVSFTNHWVGIHPQSPESVQLSFEFSGNIERSDRIISLMDASYPSPG